MPVVGGAMTADCLIYRRGPSKPEGDPNRLWPVTHVGSPAARPMAVGSLVSVLVFAEESFTPFLGDDLIVYLVLAMGAALVAGNLAAVLRPPAREDRSEGSLEQAPVTRSLVMAGIGLVAAIWALVSLVTG